MSEKIALVTGGSSGIGLEIVRALVSRGFEVLTCGTRNALPEELQSLDGVQYRSCDLATVEDRDALIAWVLSRTHTLDYLFNNAGIQSECELGPELAASSVEREIAINLTAPILLSVGLVPLLENAKGCVVNISSGLALAPKARSPIYCATKAGLSNYSQTLRVQLAPRKIRVVDVVTPLVRTPMTEGRHQGAMEPALFCAQLLSAIDRGRDEVYLGRARLLPLLMRVAPTRARRIMMNA